MKTDFMIYLYIAGFLPVLFLALVMADRKHRLSLEKRIEVKGIVNISWERLLVKRIFLLFLFLALAAALSGPRWGRVWQEVFHPAKDLIYLVDTSISMQAADTEISREAAAREKLSFLIENMNGVRAGLIFFAGSSFMQCPVTFDKNALRMFVRESWENMVPLPGSDIEKALRLAASSFPASKKASDKFIVMLTDGEELQGDWRRAAPMLKEEGVIVSAIGIGSSSGAPIPVYENGRLTGYKKDREGNTVMSARSSELLSGLASATGGIYRDYDKGISDALELIRFVEKKKSDEKKDRVVMNLAERYQLFLAIGMIFFLAEVLIDAGRKKR